MCEPARAESTEVTFTPGTLRDIGKFTETLQKIYTFIDAQKGGSIFKKLIRHKDLSILLKTCQAELRYAVEAFKVETAVNLFTDIAHVREVTERAHKDILDLIATLPDDGESRKTYSAGPSSTQTSSESFSMLPPKPKIFHGREAEIEHAVQVLLQGTARLAILGAGGMGKTSLAMAVLYHPDVIAKYDFRIFVRCDSVTNSVDLAGLIGAHAGLKPARDAIHQVVDYFSKASACLLVLDNLESAWEPLESRKDVEEFLSLLADLSHLALLVTLRGAERPGKVPWNRPFLLPLLPLSDAAAQATFIDIADDFHDETDVGELLSLTDNMPLAVNLIAHLANDEGCKKVLARWKTERTSVLSPDGDKMTSLDASIELSLSSPRMLAEPGAKALLGLLAILPDGLSNVELIQSDLPLENALKCKAILLQTALGYLENQRIRVFAPVREHMQHFYPVPLEMARPLRTYFHSVLQLYQNHRGMQQGVKTIQQIQANTGNLNHILVLGLDVENPDLAQTVRCTISLNSFRRLLGHSPTVLMDQIPALLPRLADPALAAEINVELIHLAEYNPIAEPELFIAQTIEHFKKFNNPALEALFYVDVGYYEFYVRNNLARSMQFLERGLALAREHGDYLRESVGFIYLAMVKWNTGNYRAAQRHSETAYELAQLAGNLYQQTVALRTEAQCRTQLGDYRGSILLSQKARELLALCNMSTGTLYQLLVANEAEVHLLKSEYTDAHKIYTQSVRDTSPEQSPYNHALSLLSSAEIEIMIAVAESEIRSKIATARKLFAAQGNQIALTQCEMVQADLELREGNEAVAGAMFRGCLASSSGLGNGEIRSYCLERLADIRRWPTYQTGLNWAAVYLADSQKSRNMLALQKALLFLADVFIETEEDQAASNLLTVSLEGFISMDVHRGRADCLCRFGDIALRRGDLPLALQFWSQAKPLFERASQSPQVMKMEAKIGQVVQEIGHRHEKNLESLVSLAVPSAIGQASDGLKGAMLNERATIVV
ncbi:hypothetical protein C8R46DRAFT_936492 [Mycena filopes]|nr:hypothetical protein C8R46DRAFT_936492 [Mycena filopes]